MRAYCPQCKGTKRILGAPCGACSGEGTVRATPQSYEAAVNRAMLQNLDASANRTIDAVRGAQGAVKQ
jgi:DnaJ-class molecular chaperone